MATVGSAKTARERSTTLNRQPAIEVAYGNLPLSFEPNQGQTNSQVEFLSRGRGYTLFLTATEAVLSLPKPTAAKTNETEDSGDTTGVVLRMRLVGANPSPRVSGLKQLPGRSNYFLGNDPSKWRTNVPTYAKVQYEDVYPGVDLVYYGNQRQLEYDLIVAPGSDPEAIHLAFEGADKLQKGVQGHLALHTAAGQVRLQKPLVYQETDGIRQEIPAAYVLNGGRQVGFEVGAYDADKPLIIDPVLSYSTYLGGNGVDRGFAIAVDGAGNAYVTGGANSTNFPTLNPFQAVFPGGPVDAFVTKLNAAGSALVYSTYLGGSSDDRGFDIAVDSSGNAYVTGQTDSGDFPRIVPIQVLNRGLSDAFVTKLNAAGNDLVYSTYLGGSSSDFGFGIAVDASGNAHVTGQTNSTDFPTVLPIQFANGALGDVFVAKLNAAGTVLRYSTYLGGSSSDFGFGIAVDASGNTYLTGRTNSTNFPTAVPIQPANGGGDDAFVTKLNAAGGALVYSTYLGGGSFDNADAIAVDASGNAYLTGNTDSADFPTANPFQPGNAGTENAFVAKIMELPLVAPTLPANSVVNGASFRLATDANGAITPGAIVAIFGMDLASDTEEATAVPLPTTLGDTSVTFDGVAAPLFFVSGMQINAQVPFELMAGAGTVTVQVTRGSKTSEAQPIGIAVASPGIFTLNRRGTGTGIILHAVDFQPVSESNPAQPGEFLLIYCTGLGPVQPEVPSGQAVPVAPLAETLHTPLVNIAGIPAQVTFSGLAPRFVGLYQVNVLVPEVPSGTQPLEIIINNVPGNTDVTIPVE